MHALSGVDHRALGAGQHLGGSAAPRPPGSGPEAGGVDPIIGHLVIPHVGGHFDEHRPRPAVAQLEEGPALTSGVVRPEVRGSAHLVTCRMFKVELKFG